MLPFPEATWKIYLPFIHNRVRASWSDPRAPTDRFCIAPGRGGRIPAVSEALT